MKLHPDFADGAYDELSMWASRFGALLFDNIEVRKNVKGLDAGCGAGFPLLELADMHGPSSHFTGLDVWPEALQRAQRKLSILGITNVSLKEGDAAAMPFDDDSFDLITSNLGINNFADVPKAMSECYRVARRGARFILTTNLSGHFGEFYDVFREVAPHLTPAINAQEAHRGTADSVTMMVEDAGFHVVKTLTSQFTMGFADGTALMHHRLVQFFKDGWKSVTDDEAIFSGIEKRLNASGRELRMKVPMLYVEAAR